MAKDKTQQNEIPRWKTIQDAQIERATQLVKEHGSNVEFVVVKDRIFMDETIRPIVNIDTAMDFIYRLEGRGINSDEIAEFKTDYAKLVDLISNLENSSIKMLAKTNVRTNNRNLDRKVRTERRESNKKAS